MIFQRTARQQYPRPAPSREVGGPGCRWEFPLDRGTDLLGGPGWSRCLEREEPGLAMGGGARECQTPLWFSPEYSSLWPFLMGS